ncbi:hypothetical protein [Microseira sp. BLCC-F43]|uniref:hypothetical protein n=1 Tax=Microseira sp. BLCC-F43 TaxID=3153602 RepID=UPI0035BA77C8
MKRQESPPFYGGEYIKAPIKPVVEQLAAARKRLCGGRRRRRRVAGASEGSDFPRGTLRERTNRKTR